MEHTVTALSNAIAILPEKDRAFAQSLCNAWSKNYGLSDKQMFWAKKLIDRAAKPAPAQIVVGNVLPIVAMIQAAKQHRKSPCLLIDAAPYGALRITLAGPMAKVPGSLTVTNDVKGADGRYGWVGRITQDGTFQPSSSLDDVESVTKALTGFAADPETAAAMYGQKFKRCCFCAHPLTEDVSLAMGYGPICAEKWALPHNKAAAKLVCEAA